MIKKLILALVISLTASFFPLSTLAETTPTESQTEDQDRPANVWGAIKDFGLESGFDTSYVFGGSTIESIGELISYLIDIALIAISTVAIVAIVLGGFTMVLSGIDSDNYNKGKNIVIYSIAGLIASFLSFIIVRFIDAFFK